MRLLRDRALDSAACGGSPWSEASDFPEISAGGYSTEAGLTVVLSAPLVEVHAVLTPSIKPGAKMLHAVRYKDGTIEEVHETVDAASGKRKAKVREKPGTESDKAASVAEPTKGCPAPLFEQAEARAHRVLFAFLDDEQREDYRLHGAFVARGADSGHRYMITHREQTKRMASYSFRSLYDLDEDRPLCVHDWTVPAPEEMLSLLLCVTLPGKERAVRELPEVWTH